MEALSVYRCCTSENCNEASEFKPFALRLTETRGRGIFSPSFRLSRVGGVGLGGGWWRSRTLQWWAFPFDGAFDPGWAFVHAPDSERLNFPPRT